MTHSLTLPATSVAPGSFIALSFAHDPSEKDLQCLTPHMMHWGERTWIFDLRPCLQYWHRRAAERQSSLNDLIRLTLIRLCADDGFRAVISPHPLQGVLALEVMRTRGLNGLIDLAHPMGRNVYRQLTWDNWWQVISQLGAHLASTPIGPRAFSPDRWASQCRRMQQACARMGFESPHALTQVESTSLVRRFGTTLGRLTSAALCRMPPELESFPWTLHHFAQSTGVDRHLDYPVNEWEHLREFIAEDFDRLCALPTLDARAHVLRLQWRLTLSDMSERVIPIIFRHPHSLHSESGHHKTAVLQAQFAFDGHSPRDESDPSYQFGITSWHLEVVEQIFPEGHCRGLFGDCDTAPDALLKLENQLPVPLEQFDLSSHWQPELSFSSGPHPRQDPFLDATIAALNAASMLRPLFLLTKPTILDRRGRSSLWRFLERTMTEWWQTSSSRHMLRDYYQYVDQSGRCYWVYKDTMERWYVHGIYA